MNEAFTKLSELVKSALPYSWMLVAVAITYATYIMFSITNWFFQIGTGVLIGLAVVLTYAVVMVKLDI